MWQHTQFAPEKLFIYKKNKPLHIDGFRSVFTVLFINLEMFSLAFFFFLDLDTGLSIHSK